MHGTNFDLQGIQHAYVRVGTEEFVIVLLSVHQLQLVDPLLSL